MRSTMYTVFFFFLGSQPTPADTGLALGYRDYLIFSEEATAKAASSYTVWQINPGGDWMFTRIENQYGEVRETVTVRRVGRLRPDRSIRLLDLLNTTPLDRFGPRLGIVPEMTHHTFRLVYGSISITLGGTPLRRETVREHLVRHNPYHDDEVEALEWDGVTQIAALMETFTGG